jgi:hypothetical protein
MARLITCDRHGGLEPAVTVCRHVWSDSASKWVQFPLLDGDENVSDCLCQRCFIRGVDQIKVSLLRSMCMSHFRELVSKTKASIRTAMPRECVSLGFWEKE